MGLNIKNEHVHELARRAARYTGRTQTGAIELALEKLLAEHHDAAASRQQRVSAILDAIDEHLAELPPMDFTHVMTDLLYDEDGLPR